MNLYKRIKKRVYDVMGPAKKGDTASAVFDIILCFLILLSCVTVFVDLFVNISDAVRQALIVFEYVTVGIFVFEYIMRIWVCEYQYQECNNKFAAIWEFITSFDSLIDILSIISVLFNEIPKEFAMLRMVKLVKLVRLVKMSGYIKKSEKFAEGLLKIKHRTAEIIDKGKDGDIVSKIYDAFSVVLILMSVSIILLETFPLTPEIHKAIYIFEVVLACIFSVEYVLRVWTAPLE